ncbi:MAG: hypothetical protein GY832_28680 [Chloroflexi bacterium]|nr:hypothetical protein [Chloroflexota bacterium]
MCPQIATESIVLLIASDDGVVKIRSLVVSPWSAQVVHWLIPLGRGRWNAGWGVGGGV